MRILTGFAALLAVLASGPASAAASYGGSFTVKRVVLEWDLIFIEADGILNDGGCANASRVKLPSDPNVRDLFYTMAMTALTSGKKVVAWTDGCASSPWGTVPNAYHLDIGN